MRLKIRLLCLSLVLLSFPLKSDAQEFPNWELGAQVGGMYYLGDINKIPFKTTRPAIGIFYRHNFNYRFSAKAIASGGRLCAFDSKYKSEYQKERDYSFKRDVARLNVLGEFNFLPFISGSNSTPFTTYLQGGVGMAYFPDNSKLDNLIFDLPFGFGVKYNVTKKLVCGADMLMIKTFSDDIDFISQATSETNSLKQRRVSSNKDWMSYFSIYFSYRLEYPQKCPTFD